MLHQFDRVTSESLDRLHREPLTDTGEIRRLLQRVRAADCVLRNGINRRNDPRNARVEAVFEDGATLSLENFDRDSVEQIFLNFEFERGRYFFAATPRGSVADGRVDIELPTAVYRAERRELFRSAAGLGVDRPSQVEITAKSGQAFPARVIDWSPYGVAVELGARKAMSLPPKFSLRFVDGDPSGEEAIARVCHRTPSPARQALVRLGLALSTVEPGPPVPLDRRERILEQGAAARARDGIAIARGVLGTPPRWLARKVGLRGPRPVSVPIVEYENERGESIRAIADCYGDPRGAPAVVIPPAWGRTKETLLPLAATILETFQRAGQPVTVIRFDGTNRRGESHIDPECRAPGREYLHFTFSQAVRDIQATLDFLEASREYRPSTTVLVTFSLAAVEGRRAVAADGGKRLAGWVSTVGMVDLQSALRTISGGIDYGYGLLQGVRFGCHELVGVVADMDHTGLDSIEHQLGFLEEARRDFAAIDVPVTWIHGRHDAWMDLERAREALAYGNDGRRRLIEVPTGHHLRTSREALSTFQLIAEEVSEMALGERLPGAIPSLADVDARRTAERQRLPKLRVDLREFWTDYLLGRDRRVGMELVTATAAYRNFMERQIEKLALRRGDRVGDFGAGTGDFPVHLLTKPDGVRDLSIDEVDYVPEALARGAERMRGLWPRNGIGVRSVVADLDAGKGLRLALAEESYDAVLASLLVSYLERPDLFLREVLRTLRPGGRLVLSSLKRDADISKLYADGIVEFHTPEARRALGEAAASDFESLVRSFLNDASRILDLEERGRFRFWDAREIADLVSNTGFSHVRTELAFGDPPQAVVLTARRP